ncbi:SH3 domain-containing protein [Sulfurimonas sp. HSL-1716]|uniref:SH3 domain-containing protein n=1 Tax=Hydrocurvibacter sulfurireducens TaxID=3131937 RepID=UPI0031F7E81D
MPLFFIMLFFTACTSLKTLDYGDIEDLKDLPQKTGAYAYLKDENASILDVQNDYEANYFRPWDMESIKTDVEQIKWPFNNYTSKNSYGENLRHLSQKWFDKMYARSNFDEYATVNRKAITLNFANLRSFPTDKPLFKDPNQAGEGFPFDYLQNSSVHANEPLFISHYSDDGAWVYVFTSYASGWMHSYNIAYLPEQNIDILKNSKKIYIITDGYPIKDESGQFIFYSQVGMLLPLIDENDDSYTALAITKGKEDAAAYTKVIIPKNIASADILALNRENITHVGDEMMNTKYGWGGMYKERDCSSMIRDMYAPFGIWLPRNSSQQSKVGKVISLKDMSNEEKRKTIKEYGIPFETLLHRKGHILIYAGVYNDKIIVMHDMWGIKTKQGDKSGRIVVGKTVFSSLEIGREQKFYDEKSSLLRKIDSMNIITLKP